MGFSAKRDCTRMSSIINIKQGTLRFRRIGTEKFYGLYELERIEVYKKYKRKGYGEKLFKTMISDINAFSETINMPFRKLFCTTHASNKAAHRFYEKMGMKMEAVLPDHYYKGEPELIYSLYP